MLVFFFYFLEMSKYNPIALLYGALLITKINQNIFVQKIFFYKKNGKFGDYFLTSKTHNHIII